MKISGNLVDVVKNKIYPAIVNIESGKIVSIEESSDKYDTYILPGLIDAHVHIESSLMAPSRFAQSVVPHGTVAVVADPHEICNVLGLVGLEFMITDAKSVPFKIFYTAPSCVPATSFETSGATLGPSEIRVILKKPEIVALGEMMNYPGVINESPDVLEKIQAAKNAGKPIDGHGPGLTGADLKKYVGFGITTDHESSKLEEAREKAGLGMKIMFREGSAAKNLEALAPLIKEGYTSGFFVTDDRHPTDIKAGYLNLILRKAVKLGIDPLVAIKMATLNPVRHYKLPVGLLQAGDPADLVIVDNLTNFTVLKTVINGLAVAQDGVSEFSIRPINLKSSFNLNIKEPKDFIIKSDRSAQIRVIKVMPGQITTNSFEAKLVAEKGELLSDLKSDIIKIAVASRYGNNKLGVGFINGFGIKRGAIASSVAHDSHNIVAVGADNDSLAKAINKIIEIGGGLVVTNGDNFATLKLPIAGLMSYDSVDEIAAKFGILEQRARELGSSLKNPFATLSFMSLLVIPELKLSDQGLFDVKKFKFVDLITDNYENFTV